MTACLYIAPMKRFWMGLLLCVVIIFPTNQAEANSTKGLWVTCIGDSEVLSSRANIDQLVGFAQSHAIKILFVQVYRGDQAWFKSEIADPTPYATHLAKEGTDTFQYLIERAHAAGIEVHAWINTLTLSQNHKAKFLESQGNTILTKDQHRRNALKVKWKDPLERYYLKEDQLFLEPGDWRVKARVKGIVAELVQNYPALDGIHFDYIRYPVAVPYIPGSRFNKVGLSYGYGESNLQLFKKRHNATFDPYKIDYMRAESELWDDWKRERLTVLLDEATRDIKKAHPRVRFSCAVLAAMDRAYLAAFQDWPSWIRDGVVDFVVLMNYSTDARYVELQTQSAIGLVGKDRVFVGLGAFLMKGDPASLAKQVMLNSKLYPAGLVFFDYDTFLESPALVSQLSNKDI